MLGCSPKEWALNMVREDCELDTLALIAIRNMLDVSLLNLLKLIAIVDFVTHAIRKPGNLETFQVRYPKTVQCVIRKCCCRFLCVLLDQVNNPRHFLRGSCQHLVDILLGGFKFTLKPPYRIAISNFFSAIWDTSHWNFLVKFGLKTA